MKRLIVFVISICLVLEVYSASSSQGTSMAEKTSTKDKPITRPIILKSVHKYLTRPQQSNISTKLQNTTLHNNSPITPDNPLPESSFTGNWPRFFSRYEIDVAITPPPVLTLPPFPLAANLQPFLKTKEWVADDITLPAKTKDWHAVLSAINNSFKTAKNTDQLQRLRLTYGETLIRLGEHTEPFKVLDKIFRTCPDSELGTLALFLNLYLQAGFEDPYLAFLELERLDKDTAVTKAIIPYFNILLAETAIMSGKIKKADTILKRNNIIYRGRAKLLRRARQADIMYLENKKTSALASYQKLAAKSDILNELPLSLAHFCDILYKQKRYKEAATQYGALADLTMGHDLHGLVLFRVAMSRLHNSDHQKTTPFLARIQDDYPGTEGAYRARMKLADLYFLAGTINSTQAAEEYKVIYQEAHKRLLREEAIFKQALVHAINNDNVSAVELAMKLIREFATGGLKTEAQALIVERLPLAIRNLISHEKNAEALILAKRSRYYFRKGWLPSSLFDDIALAFAKIGAYNRSTQVLQYLLEMFPNEKHDNIYLPLIKTLFADGHYDQVEKYAGQYLADHTEGLEVEKILQLRIKALQETDRIASAAELLDKQQGQISGMLIANAVNIYFEQKRFNDVIRLLQPKIKDNTLMKPALLFKLAESYFQTEDYDAAGPLFRDLISTKLFQDQATYRAAQVLLRQDKQNQAVDKFNELTAKGINPLWRKLAAENIEIISLCKELNKNKTR